MIGKRDETTGRIPVGPFRPATETERQYEAKVRGMNKETIRPPSYLQPPMVTLFGPPNDPKMTKNAVNAWHRGKQTEGPVQKNLVEGGPDSDSAYGGRTIRSYWGADKEDSVAPTPRGNAVADYNLDRVLNDAADANEIVPTDHATFPIKRIPGLALPDAAHVLDGKSPMPMHIVDFAMHVYRNCSRPESLVFYVPKLENELEARYLNFLIQTVERMIRSVKDPSYEVGTVKVLIVFESARAVFRMNEIAYELRDHFVGGSLGWHDYLASVARIMRYDPRYRIPVKKDPNIVLHHIKTSHVELASTMHSIGAIAIGGMYGVLPEKDPINKGRYHEGSYQAAMKGYFMDVVAQFFRGLDGFWVAHPDFVRLGIAIVAALRLENDSAAAAEENGHLFRLIDEVLTGEQDRADVKAFVRRGDRHIGVLNPSDPLYNRALLAADVEMSTHIANDDIEEVRYNVFQALQYLVDWLKGNGCVALPANLERSDGESVPVRVMDDLATTERSRWELWHVVYHKLVKLQDFLQVLREELQFIKTGRNTATKHIAVPWDEKWYPVAVRILCKLVTDPNPSEFVTELLLPFTTDTLRNSSDPWQTVMEIEPTKFAFHCSVGGKDENGNSSSNNSNSDHESIASEIFFINNDLQRIEVSCKN